MTMLNGKTALVTGGAHGTGRISALALADAGAQVLIHYSGAGENAAAVVAEIRANGGKADMIAADLRTSDGILRLAGYVRAVIGARLDVLVASAHSSIAKKIEETTIEDFNYLFDVNVRAPYFLVQQLMPTMCKGSNIILVWPHVPRAEPGTVSTCAMTAGAINTFVKHLASSLGMHGIRVNAIAPDTSDIDTPFFGEHLVVNQCIMDRQFARHMGAPGTIGAAAVFLASDAARWITANTLRINVGFKPGRDMRLTQPQDYDVLMD